MNQRLSFIAFAGCIIVAGGIGCQSGGGAGESTTVQAEPGAARTTGQSGRPLAYVDGRAVTLSDVYGPLVEAAGPAVLQELVLDRALADQLAQRGVVLDEAAVDAERALLMQTLSPDANEAARLLQQLRARRGLGEVRFQALLWRNAAMRALVAEQVQVNDTAVRQRYELMHGPSVRARIIVVETAAAAGTMRQRALAGEDFALLAAAHSLDESAGVGGLLPLISPVDPTFPQGVRNALAGLDEGELTDVVALEGGFAVLRVDGKIEADGTPLDEVRGALTTSVRREAERQLMSQLAQALLAEADFVPLDPALHDAWEAGRGGNALP